MISHSTYLVLTGGLFSHNYVNWIYTSLIKASIFVVPTPAAASGLPSPVSVLSLQRPRIPFIPTSAVAPRPGLPRTSKKGRSATEDHSDPWDWRGTSITAAAAIVAAITAALTCALIAYCPRTRAVQHSTRPDHAVRRLLTPSANRFKWSMFKACLESRRQCTDGGREHYWICRIPFAGDWRHSSHGLGNCDRSIT